MTKETEQARQKLLPAFKAAKKANIKCHFRGEHLVFGQNPTLRQCLIDTGDKQLLEANPNDRIWGIGMSMRNKLSTSPEYWHGKNLMGQILTQVREALRSTPMQPLQSNNEPK